MTRCVPRSISVVEQATGLPRRLLSRRVFGSASSKLKTCPLESGHGRPVACSTHAN